ncbi:peptidoglycan recognition protein-like [Uloborus diversus]|uniref:peptidoglycan recognition protein-like n=1 Tax=Uloborus diversus TaxID=327109 RepID=UPI002409FB7E|nr:peptidoglycan recognition protein-like [Uloborus diversus]
MGLKCALKVYFLWIFIVNTYGRINEAGKEDPDCKGLSILSRKAWRARPSVRVVPISLPVNHVIIIHTADVQCKNTPQCIRIVQFTQNYHLDYNGWWDIGYNFLIGGEGLVYEGVGWKHVGAHTFNFNFISMGIAFMGDFRNATPNNRMLDAAQLLIECGKKKGYLSPYTEIHGHRDAICTISPGDKLYAIIKQWKNFIGGRLPMYSC